MNESELIVYSIVGLIGVGLGYKILLWLINNPAVVALFSFMGIVIAAILYIQHVEHREHLLILSIVMLFSLVSSCYANNKKLNGG